MTQERAPLLHRIGEAGARIGSRPPRSRPLRVAVQLGLALVVFGFLVLTVANQWGELRERGVDLQPLWLLPAAAVMPLFYVAGAIGWDLILRFLGYRLSPARAQLAWGQPLLARYVPGSVLYVFGRLLLSEREGVPRRITLASIVYEQALAATAAALVASAFFLGHPDLEDEPLRFAALAVIPVALALLHPRIFGPLAERALRAFGRERLPRTIPMRGVLAMVAFYVMQWAVIGISVFCVARAVHFVAWQDLAVVASAQAIGYLAALASLVFPAGLGVRDAAFAWAVKAALPHRSFAVGAAIAIAVRALQTAVEVGYVAVVTLYARRHPPGARAAPLEGQPCAEVERGEREHPARQ